MKTALCMALAVGMALTAHVAHAQCSADSADVLGTLIGDVPAAQPCRLVRPDWYAADFDLDATVDGVEGVLAEQASGPADGIRRLVFSDADRTLLKTSAPLLLRHKDTGALFRDPETGLPVILLGDEQLEKYQERFPNVDWSQWRKEWKEFGSVAEILRSPAIGETLDVMRASDAAADSREFVITARFLSDVDFGLDAWLAAKGVDVDGVMVVNHFVIRKKLGLNGHGFASEHRKAVTMAALMKLYGFDEGAGELPVNLATASQLEELNGIGETLAARIVAYRSEHGDFATVEDLSNVSGIGPVTVERLKPLVTTTVREVTYYDDDDDNLKASMALLPVLYPHVRFRFVDVVHTGNRDYEHVEVARTYGAGGLATPGGVPLCADQVDAYASDDAPEPVDPELDGPWVLH